jgi:hypothetical protein
MISVTVLVLVLVFVQISASQRVWWSTKRCVQQIDVVFVILFITFAIESVRVLVYVPESLISPLQSLSITCEFALTSFAAPLLAAEPFRVHTRESTCTT